MKVGIYGFRIGGNVSRARISVLATHCTVLAFDRLPVNVILEICDKEETTTEFVDQRIYAKMLTCGLLKFRGAQCTITAN